MAKSRANRASPSRPYEVLFQMVIGKWISQALGTVVEIGVPEQLAKGARRCSDIAHESGVSEDGLPRLAATNRSQGVCTLGKLVGEVNNSAGAAKPPGAKFAGVETPVAYRIVKVLYVFPHEGLEVCGGSRVDL